MFGAGLQLQPQFPGTRNQGNANMTGTFLASFGSFPGSLALRNRLGDTSADPFVNVFIGDNTRCNWVIGNGDMLGCVTIGPYAGMIPNTGHQMAGSIAIGRECVNRETASVGIGLGVDVGGPGSSGANGGIVMGAGSRFLAGQTLGSPIMIGAAMVMRHSGAIGNVARSSLLIGNGIFEDMAGANEGANIVIAGAFSNVFNCYNNIILDTNSDIGFGTKVRAGLSNSIIIGNSDHRNIFIGGLSFGNGFSGTVQQINDANYVIQPTDGTVGCTAITANRTWTLPAASAMVPGGRILCVDQSGAASAVTAIVIVPVGADLINGGPSKVLDAGYAFAELMSDGISGWTVIR